MTIRNIEGFFNVLPARNGMKIIKQFQEKKIRIDHVQVKRVSDDLWQLSSPVL